MQAYNRVATVATISHTHISLYREIIRLDPYQLIAFIYIYTCGYVATVATYVWNPLILPGLAAVSKVATRVLKWLPVVTARKSNSKSLAKTQKAYCKFFGCVI